MRDIKEEALAKASKSSEKIAFRGKIITAKKREKTRVETVYRVVKKHLLRSIKILRTYYNAHPFYQDLVKLFYPEEEIRISLKRLEGSLRTLEMLRTSYMDRLKYIRDTEEAARIRKEALGRILSIPVRRKKQLNYALELWKYAHKLPSIDFDEPIVVISGPPNVGKSSLINRLSTAKVKVASYPFTTKEIHVGHIETKYFRIQLIDTPGLLDRPLKERNEVEMQAIYALKHLPDLILFMFDPSPGRYYEPDKQVAIYREIRELFGDKPYLLVINKIDDKEVDIEEFLEEDAYKISILKDLGVEELRETILNKVLKRG